MGCAVTVDGQARYERIVRAAQADPAVVGLVLTGSRGRGAFVRAGSDWDVRLVVQDTAFADAVVRYGTAHGSPVEVAVVRLSTFRRLSENGSDIAWDRYSYVGTTVVVDRLDGAFTRMVEELARLAPGPARALAAARVDGYINAYYRSLENSRAGLTQEAHLDAAESVPLLLDLLFAIHERVRPFNRFLRWELERSPLPGDAWAIPVLLNRLEAVLSTGATDAQAALFRDVEVLARSHGHGDVVDAWEPDVDWLRDGGPG
jgi:hypothetical protein